MCNPACSDIDNDPRKPFYSKVKAFSGLYASSIGLCGAYGHKVKAIGLDELIHFDGVVTGDGFCGESNGALYCCWIDGAIFDEHIAEFICH
jgi:hypothetical protein